jgi:hypothetical protein
VLPDLPQWIRELPDTRQAGKCDYAAELIHWCGLTLLMGSSGSRDQYNLDRDKPATAANVAALSGLSFEKLPDGDTVNYLLEQIPAAAGLGQLPGKMVHRLLRSRVLDDQRLWDEMFMIAVDATEQFSSSERHCEHCLVQKLSNGTTRYFHSVLQAMLVTRGGMVLPVASVPIGNTSAVYDKQDCELKAFPRLVEQLHRRFPQLRICLLMDCLYFSQDVMTLCRTCGWDWIITFKEGKTPALWKSAQAVIQDKNVLEHVPDKKTHQQFRWCHNLRHGEAKHQFHAIFCRETRTGTKGKMTVTQFAWGTSIRPDRNNVIELANHGGRPRWKIENEGFKTLKHDICGLDHGYGTKKEALMNWHHLIEVTFIILQLVEHSDILTKLPPPPAAGRIRRSTKPLRPILRLYSTFKNFHESLRFTFLSLRLKLSQIAAFPAFQFRLCSAASG